MGKEEPCQVFVITLNICHTLQNGPLWGDLPGKEEGLASLKHVRRTIYSAGVRCLRSLKVLSGNCYPVEIIPEVIGRDILRLTSARRTFSSKRNLVPWQGETASASGRNRH